MDLSLLYYGLKWGFGFGKADPINIVFRRNKQVQIFAGDRKEISFGKGADGFPVEAKRPNTPKHFLSDGRPVHVFVQGKPEAVDVVSENRPSYEDVELRNILGSAFYFNQALEKLYELPKKLNINWKLVIALLCLAFVGFLLFYLFGGYEMLASFGQPGAFVQPGANFAPPNPV